MSEFKLERRKTCPFCGIAMREVERLQDGIRTVIAGLEGKPIAFDGSVEEYLYSLLPEEPEEVYPDDLEVTDE